VELQVALPESFKENWVELSVVMVYPSWSLTATWTLP